MTCGSLWFPVSGQNLMADSTRLLSHGPPASHFPLRMSRLPLLERMKFAFRFSIRVSVTPVRCLHLTWFFFFFLILVCFNLGLTFVG